MSFAGKKANQSLISDSSKPKKKLKPLPRVVTVVSDEYEKNTQNDKTEEIGGELSMDICW